MLGDSSQVTRGAFLFENCSLYYYLSSHCKRQGEKRQGEGELLDKLKTFMGEKKNNE